MDGLLLDLRYATRALRRDPVAVVVAVLLLALGIGANATIFTLVDSFYLKPIPVLHPGELTRIYSRLQSGSLGAGFSQAEYQRIRDANGLFSGVAAETMYSQFHLIWGEQSREVRAEFVSADYFSILGLQPQFGRFFTAAEDAPGTLDVVISNGLWRSLFLGSPKAVGAAVTINGVPMTVVGVMPGSFAGDIPGDNPEIWAPSSMLARVGKGCTPSNPDCTVIESLLARRVPGLSLQNAQAELGARAIWSSPDYANRKREIVVYPATGLDPSYQRELRPQMRLLMAATAALLLIACANLAGLFFVRSSLRRREVAVRLAIGASRIRVARELFIESLLVACAGGISGILASTWGTAFLARYYTLDNEGYRHVYNLTLDSRIIAYSAVLALATAALFGLAPAWQVVQRNLVVDLKSGGASVGSKHGGQVRIILVASQLAITLVLLVGSGLLVHSVRALQQGANFDPEGLYLVRIRPEMLKYPPERNNTTITAVMERLRSTPGVESASFMQGGEGLVWLWSSGRDVNVSVASGKENAATISVLRQEVSGGFFETMRIPVRRGRAIDDRDTAGAVPVVMVNDPLARKLWPSGSAVGQELLVNGTPHRVVGIPASTLPEGPISDAGYKIYLSYWQWQPGTDGDYRIVVRMAGSAAAAQQTIHKVIEGVDRAVPIGEEMRITQQVSTVFTPAVLARSVVTYCGLLALGMSTLGLFSLLAYSVRSRTREIGVRLALGGTPGHILRLVLRQATSILLVGVTVGLIVARIGVGMLSSFFYGTRSLDWLVYVASAALLCAVAFAAAVFPARRASHVDPMVALRDE